MSDLADDKILNPQQQQAAVALMREYLAAPGKENGKTFVQEEAAMDAERVALIEKDLAPLVRSFLAGTLPFSQFKSRILGINQVHRSLWGFGGMNGRMFFNVVANASEGASEELDQELKAVLAEPANETLAASRLKTFESYVKRIGDAWVEAGNSAQSRPKLGSVSFFVSYFWQVQNRHVWPVYFTNSVRTLTALNLWDQTGNRAEDYLRFKRLHEELAVAFTNASGKKFTLYDVEHVFWFKGGNPYDNEVAKPATVGVTIGIETAPHVPVVAEDRVVLPDSFVPPVVAVLPLLARHDGRYSEAAQKAGTSIARAFERAIDASFTILGYETKLLGQGQGRVPDGLAEARDQNYAIIWDGKVRTDGYSMGTDDRVIWNYVTTQSRELKRRSHLRNIYYCVVSSVFAEGYDEQIATLKMETDVNEVVLVEAAALVAMVDIKLHDPLGMSLGPDGLQRLFTSSGILTAEMVREFLN